MNRAEKRRQKKLAQKAARNIKLGKTTGGAAHRQTPVKQSLSLAIEHHTAGRLSEAESLYQQILQAEPDQPVALHLLGVIANQVGKNDIAVDLISKAVTFKPDYVEAHSNLGIALNDLGRFDEAVASCLKALALKPDYAEAHNNLGNALQGQGKPDEAVASYQQALASKADNAQAHNNLGVTLRDLGRLDEAVVSYHRALAINADYAEAHSNLGIVLKDLGKLDEVLECCLRAIAIKPDFVEAHSNLGNVLKDLGRLDEALASYQKALAIKPDYFEARYNLGVVLCEQGKLEEAVTAYLDVIAIKPDYTAAHSNIGNAYYGLGKLDQAMAAYQKAIAINPNFAEAWYNLNYVVKAQAYGNPDVAGVEGLSAAARASADFALHQFYLDSFRPHAADESFDSAMAVLPDMCNETISAGSTSSTQADAPHLADKLVALLHFGRSGTGLLHSLIDGHPEMTTLPSVYLRGYFNKGVWDKLSANGWQNLPERFADEFAVLFDARTSRPIPSRLGEPAFNIGINEGMTAVGENRDEFLTLDRGAFCAAALRMLEAMQSVDPMSFLKVIHAAFEEVAGLDATPKTRKSLCFYHIHNPDAYAMPNFLRYGPDARLLMTVREPIQNCESSLRASFTENDYDKCMRRLLGLLFDIDQVHFRIRPSVGVRLEDLKTRPQATLQALCGWLGVEDSPTLYQMTAQGKKWWGDPSSPDYGKDKAMSPFDDVTTKRPVGAILSEKDQFLLGTLFYPFSVRFGYRQTDPDQFEKDVAEIRPLLDEMMDFEKTMAERANIDQQQFRKNGTFRLLRAGLVERWNVLHELGDYPHMLKPLPIT